jgi:hypothetical protein
LTIRQFLARGQVFVDEACDDPAAEITPAKPVRARAARYNHYGQKIGSKGERTRQTLIDVTVDLLETHGLRDVSVADVARVAKTSPATFYVYFRGCPKWCSPLWPMRR